MAYIDEVLDKENAPKMQPYIGWRYTEEDEDKIEYAKKCAQEFMDNYGKGKLPDKFCRYLFT